MGYHIVVCPECKTLNKVSLEQKAQAAAICGRCGQSLSMENPVQALTTLTFNKMIEKSPLPVVVDFWAPWCGPCRSFAPIYQKTAEKWLGRLVFAKVNTQDFPQISGALGIRGIPTVAVFHHGKELARQAGMMPQPVFENWLRPYS